MLASKQSLANAARPLADFVPYSTHVSNFNVRTVGGDTLTIIKLAGVAHECADDEDIQSWHDALTNLLRNVATEKVALWMHTLREERSEYPAGSFENNFAGRLNEHYRESLSGVQLMANVHYVTLLVRGKSPAMKLLDFGAKKTAASVLESISDASARLDELADTVLAGLSRYAPRRLSTYSANGVVYSETLEFLSRLINGEWQSIAVPKGRAAFGMVSSRVSFGVDQLEIRSPTHVRVGAILAASAYQVERTEPGHLNVMLTLPFPFVLTQSFAIYGRNKAMAALQRQQRLLINAEDASETQIADIGQLRTPGLDHLGTRDVPAPGDRAAHAAGQGIGRRLTALPRGHQATAVHAGRRRDPVFHRRQGASRHRNLLCPATQAHPSGLGHSSSCCWHCAQCRLGCGWPVTLIYGWPSTVTANRWPH